MRFLLQFFSVLIFSLFSYLLNGSYDSVTITKKFEKKDSNMKVVNKIKRFCANKSNESSAGNFQMRDQATILY